jgi:hypothetical protein
MLRKLLAILLINGLMVQPARLTALEESGTRSFS